MGREYAGEDPAIGAWRDVQLEITGGATKKLQMIFADDWFFATEEKLLDPRYYVGRTHPPRSLVQPITDCPDGSHNPIEMSIVLMLNSARSRVWLTAGYFAPHEPLAHRLAARRGARRRSASAHLGETESPHTCMQGVLLRELLRYGVKIYEYEIGINHAKVALIDEGWLMVGSANFDVRSMRLNFELNLLVRDPVSAGQLERVLSEDFESSNRIVAEEFARRSRWQRWKESLVRPLAPLL